MNTTTKAKKAQYVTATAAAFQGVRTEGMFRVDADGTVRAWDSISQTYTLCHSLPDSDVAMLREKAGFKA